MNVFYEEDGAFKAASILSDNTTSLQVEAAHGKRSKIKANAVLLRFNEPPLGEFMERAQGIAAELDPAFLWECAGTEEFGFAELAREYFGREPAPAEAAALLIRLHAAPIYFYKKGKGRYKPATTEAVTAALASEERKRVQAEKMAGYVAHLTEGILPDAFRPHLTALLFKPDKNALEYKALEKACADTGLSAVRLLQHCGAISSPHAYHLQKFLFESFPSGTSFGGYVLPSLEDDLPLADVSAFSIDDETTTEIDDAFSVRFHDAGATIGIHIAAPGLGIETNSQLDEIARNRLSTVYMPGEKITMLPDDVVSLYTLREGCACPAISLYFDIDGAYEITRIRSRIERVSIGANLHHDKLEATINAQTLARGDSTHPLAQEFGCLWEVAQRLEAQRIANGANSQIHIDYNFYVDDDRVRITERQRGAPVDKIVAELMIFVNSQWAETLMRQGIPALYRTQDNGKVRMSMIPAPHRGLGAKQYMWSSSPLRRYIDLVNQRQLIALLTDSAPPHTDLEWLAGTMRSFDLAYEAYANIQRSMERYWCLRWMQQEHVDTMTATVLRENLVRFDHLPFWNRVNGMPTLAPGTVIEVGIGEIDLLELTADVTFKAECTTAPVAAL